MKKLNDENLRKVNGGREAYGDSRNDKAPGSRAKTTTPKKSSSSSSSKNMLTPQISKSTGSCGVKSSKSKSKPPKPFKPSKRR